MLAGARAGARCLTLEFHIFEELDPRDGARHAARVFQDAIQPLFLVLVPFLKVFLVDEFASPNHLDVRDISEKVRAGLLDELGQLRGHQRNCFRVERSAVEGGAAGANLPVCLEIFAIAFEHAAHASSTGAAFGAATTFCSCGELALAHAAFLSDLHLLRIVAAATLN